jgi:uncharacterized membrane protein YqgA involved in biofilm formation
MKTALSSESMKKSITAIGMYFGYHRRMIFFIVTLGALIGAMLDLNLILNSSSDDAYRQTKIDSSQSTHFDTTTIKRINGLTTTQAPVTNALPPGRNSPFSE